MSAFSGYRSALSALPAATGAVALSSPAWAEEPISTVSYACKDSKTIEASYFDGRVEIELGDGRAMTLPQTPSGSGIRDADQGETIVFWSKGDEAFVTEGAAEEMTYADCKEQPE